MDRATFVEPNNCLHDKAASGLAEFAAPQVTELEYLWGGYKYRYELCWNAVTKLSTAVGHRWNSALYEKRVHEIPAALATLLAIFGIFVLRNELSIFAETKVAYPIRPNEFLRVSITDARDKRIVHDFKGNPQWTLFDLFVPGIAARVERGERFLFEP